ncbi:hypothetical protein BKA82DRAFT_4221263 [Pisolithus tinctorius]|nr:hypothetical protein BKA82DRAFT_4221263 [Pisolithus tinctorius]
MQNHPAGNFVYQLLIPLSVVSQTHILSVSLFGDVVLFAGRAAHSLVLFVIYFMLSPPAGGQY